METIMEFMFGIREWTHVWYHLDTKEFSCYPLSKEQMKNISWDAKIPDYDPINFRFLSYEEINHRDIMRFFVNECVDDKAVRKQLFDCLRRHDFVDVYLIKLHELDYYDLFCDTCESIYMDIFYEWVDKNNLSSEFKQ